MLWREDVPQVVARALIVGEEEELVLQDRTADGQPELLVVGVGLLAREVVLGQGAVAVAEEEADASDVVGPDLRVTLVTAPPAPPELRVVVARAHADRPSMASRTG
jgi:hypothetical protein